MNKAPLLIAHFNAIRPLTAAEQHAIDQSLVIRQIPKGTVVLKAGQVAKASYFVLSGLVRQYVLKAGEELTQEFFTEGEWVISLNSFMNQVPATHYLVCEEDCVLVAGTADDENKLMDQHPDLQHIARRVIEAALAKQQQHTENWTTLDAEARYDHLLKTRSDLIQRVPQYQLASYIGIKPESLSRIRRRMQQAEKKDQSQTKE